MIIFHTNYDSVYNRIIHLFLKKDIFDTNKDLGDIVEKLCPKYLRREQFRNCENAFQDLYNWSCDNYNHELRSIHQIILYKFLLQIKARQKRTSNFEKKYFDSSTKYFLDCHIKDNTVKNNFFNIDYYLTQLFKDSEFLLIEKHYNNGTLQDYLSKNSEKTILYYDVLPMEIQKIFNYDYVDLFYQIQKLLLFIEESCDNGNLPMLFWENNIPVDEIQIQTILENIMDAYFYNKDFDITREALVGSGKIDFKFYKNRDEKLLFEIKKAENSHLKDGYETQIIKYMKSWHCKHAFYIIICFTDDDYKKATQFIRKRENCDEYHEYVQIRLFDFRKKKNSNFINCSNFIQEPLKKVEKFFSYISTLHDIQDVKGSLIYLQKLKDNYNRLPNAKLKEEYIKKIYKVCTQNIKTTDYIERVFNSDKFYIIIDSSVSIKQMIISLFSNVTNEQKFYLALDSSITYFSTKMDICNTCRIKKDEIDNIFSFIKEVYPTFYSILTTLNLDIYMFDVTDKESDCHTMVCDNFKNFSLGCYYMNDSEYYQNGIINPMYMFFYQLGSILYLLSSNKYNILLELPMLNTTNKNEKEISSIFAYTFAIYLMHNSIYEQYSPCKSSNQKLYTTLEQYFKKLLDKIIEKEGVENDSF